MSSNISRTPVYFVSHGGPTTMFAKDHPVYPKLEAIGLEITKKVKPDAIVVFSAHWQAERPNTIEINTAESEDLIYDYYGFPRHYYTEKFSNHGSPAIAERISMLLKEHGIASQQVERGLDHGVFVPFKIMFNETNNPLSIPIVQVSLFSNHRDAQSHIKLGRAVQALRDENIVIIASGMAVHNLRHLMMVRGGLGGDVDDLNRHFAYGEMFDDALKTAVETEPGEERDRRMVGLLERQDAKLAHPTFEHLLPIHIGVGAAGKDKGEQTWTFVEGPMGWAQYRFGDVHSAANI